MFPTPPPSAHNHFWENIFVKSLPPTWIYTYISEKSFEFSYNPFKEYPRIPFSRPLPFRLATQKHKKLAPVSLRRCRKNSKLLGGIHKNVCVCVCPPHHSLFLTHCLLFQHITLFFFLPFCEYMSSLGRSIMCFCCVFTSPQPPLVDVV